MSNVIYVMKRLLHMNYKQMFQKINGIHKKTGKSRLYILKDMQRCANLYGAGYSDYDLYEMYNLTPQQRDTYLTRGRNNALVAKYNDPAYVGIFDDKLQMDVRFKDFLGRDFTTMKTDTDKDQVIAFLKAHDIVIAKPANGMCGHGVEKIEVAKEGGPQKVYEHLKANKSAYVVEEVIVQHPAVSAIYPLAINTCRIVTILKDGEVHVICAYFRIGNKGHHVDNFNSEGMVAPVDEKTGIVKDYPIDKKKNLYKVHPMTGTPIKGFQFPDWDKATDLVKRASMVIPQVAYIGWDVAFSDKGPVLVEGNDFAGHDIYQLPEHTHDHMGIYPLPSY